MRYSLLSDDTHHLVYGWRGTGWTTHIPYRIQRVIVAAWNPVACRIWGHFWLPNFDTAIGQHWTEPDTDPDYPQGALEYLFSAYIEEHCVHCDASRVRLNPDWLRHAQAARQAVKDT